MKQLLRKDWKNRIKDTVFSPLELLRAMSELTEEATRVMEFSRGLKKMGAKGAGEAALASRDITLDFGRAGTIGKHANRYYTFLNAWIQGLDKMARQFRQHPVRSTIKAVMSITMPSVTLFFINHDNEYYQEVPQWEKDIFWLVPYNEGRNFIRIPKPFELGILFGTLPERMLSYFYDQDPKAFNKFGNTIRRNMFFDLLPDKDFYYLPPGIFPTAISVPTEMVANRSMFTGHNIIPRREENLEPALQFGAYTSELAKLVGKTIDVPPRMVDHVIYGYTAGLGRNVVGIVDRTMDQVGLVERTPKPGGTVAELPIIKAFVSRNPTAGQSTTIDLFYEEYSKAEGLYKSLKVKLDNNEEIPKLSKQDIARLQSLKAMRKATRELSEMRKISRQVQETKKLSPKQKKDILREIDRAQINYVRTLVGMEPL